MPKAAISIVDDRGSVITLAQRAMRIVSLAPHATELLFAAGAGDAVVGAIEPIDFPPAAVSVAPVGNGVAIDIEKVIALAPDLVIAWPYLPPGTLDRLQAAGIPVYVSDPASIDAIAGSLERLATLTGTESVAIPAARAFRQAIAATRERYAGRARLRVFYEIWNEPLYTIGKDHLIDAALGLCSADNVFGKLAILAPAVSVEAVLAANPDAIVAGTKGGAHVAWLDTWRRFPQLSAVRRGALLTVNADLLHRSGPRFAEGVAALCAALDETRRN